MPRNFKMTLIFLFLLHLAGCQLWKELPDSESKTDDQPPFEAPFGLSSTDERFFMTVDGYNKLENGNKVLSSESVVKDKADLIYALQNAYAGKHFIEKKRFNHVLARIESIKGPILRMDFFNEVRTLLYSLPDGHLSVTTLDGILPKNVYYRKEKILGPEQKYWWKLEMHVIKGKDWHVLTLTKFPYSEDPKWDELYTALNSITKSNGLIIDLRDNVGGFSKSSHHLRQYFRASATLNTPSKIYFLNSPLATILRMNRINDDYRGRHNNVSFSRLHIESESLKYNLKYPKEVMNNYSEKLPLARFPPNPLLQKVMLYLIVDGGCASACEDFSEHLKQLSDVVTIGQNTAGVLHFATGGLLFLRNSGTKISLPTSYVELFSKKFFEGSGFEPEFRVKKTDSIDKTFETYLNSQN